MAHDITLKTFGPGSLLVGHRALRLGVVNFAQDKVKEAASLLYTAKETLQVRGSDWSASPARSLCTSPYMFLWAGTFPAANLNEIQQISSVQGARHKRHKQHAPCLPVPPMMQARDDPAQFEAGLYMDFTLLAGSKHAGQVRERAGVTDLKTGQALVCWSHECP